VKDARASLSYAELDRRANRLARWLRARGIGRGVAVAVCLPRSVGMIVSQLAVLKAGGHYVSLDPSQPPERLLAMAREAKIGCALTTPAHVGRDWGAQASLCDAPEIARESDAPLGTSVHEDDLAYIIFTSGSTGVPKGVQLRHGGLANLVRTYARTFELGPRDRSSQTAAPSFDSSVAEIWPALCAGSALCIPPDEARSEPGALVTWMRDERVTVCFMPTPLGEACLAEDWTGSSLRILMIAGDKLHTVDARRTFAIDNQYGPTEYTVCTTHHWLERDVVATPSIGRPLDNTRTYVLDAQLRPSAIGVPGELYIAGLGLARGYTRPDLTAERFLPDPYGPPGSRMYRTGDLVRWNASNVLEFIGRVDHQVKLRGFRIELSEIESTLLEHDAVREAVVVARGDTDKKLVGYLVMRSECTDDDLRVHLKKTLPEYMVPALFVRLAELPHNSSGKIDRKALPAPDFTTAQAEYVAPRTHVEEKLVAIFSEILGIARVGVHDDFFVLGGHSLSAVRIVARARDELRAALPVRALFDAPTVAKLAAVITGTRALSSGPLVPLRRGEGRRLAFFHALSGELFAYGPLAQRLAPFDVSGLRARELATVPESVPALAKHYADALTHDGVVLCGWSMGGLVAFETARELERRGRPPAALVMLDTYVLSAAPRREDEPDALAYARDVAWELEPADGAALRTEIERAPHDAIGALVRALRIEERELVDRVRIHATLARAARAYVPDGTPPSTPIHFVAPDPELPLRTWGGRITPRTTSRVPGDHHSMLRSHADALARTFLAILDDE